MAGDDQITGGGGNDTVTYVNDGAVVVDLAIVGAAQNTVGAGLDTFIDAIENLTGSTGGDQLFGDGAANIIDGGFGNDTINGRGGDDSLIGGSGINVLIGGANNDIYDGTFGFSDTADFSGFGGGATVNLSLAGPQNTGEGNDTFLFIEHLTGGGGADRFTGDAAANLLMGNGGADILRGGLNNDNLQGGNGNDQLFGEDGNDVLIGGAGDDLLDGGAGTDTADYSANPGAIDADLQAGTVEGGSTDTIANIENITGSGFADTIRGSGAAEFFDGGDGNDVLEGRGGNDFLIGQNGDDVLDGGAGADTLNGGNNDDTMRGGDGNDIISDTQGSNRFEGGAGNDVLQGNVGNVFDDVFDGGDGNDNLFGGGGNDSFLGGAGNDILQGGAGNDLFNGGAGIDTVNLTNFTAPLIVDLGLAGPQAVGGGHGNDTFIGIEKLIGGFFADTFTGSAGNDILQGGQGNDLLNGGAGVDIASYADTGSRVFIDLIDTEQKRTGGLGTDTFNSIEGVIGGTNRDVLTGTGQGNILQGGLGIDVLTGGAGADQFRYVNLQDGGLTFLNTPIATQNGLFGDFVNDFTTGEDSFVFDSGVFGLPTGPLGAANFASIIDPYDGTNSGIAAGTPVFVFSENDGTLYFDADTSVAGYSVIANVLAGSVAQGDIQIQAIA
jgi:Ca2+-binding RTX toxin-like protein